MNLLIIGGTVFLGRHLVQAALQAGHNVTTFNRGNHELAEQADVEKLIGDRNNFEVPQDRTWDAVIDTCGMEPEVVSISAEKLSDLVGRYVFISSISAFDNFREAGMTEAAPARLIPPDSAQDYGSRKAYCEKVVNETYSNEALVIRPGLIVGPYDPSDRFTYWVRRIARGGQVIAPGRPSRPVQFIDVQDLAEWIIRMVQAKMAGTYNATGPGYEFTMKELLQNCKEASESQAELIWIDDENLLDAGVTPWTEMPLWIPESEAEFVGFMQVDCNKAMNRGLSYRRPLQTIDTILQWDSERDPLVPLKAGIDSNKEKQILASFVRT